MTKLEESSSDTLEEHIIPCDCHDWHYLRFRWDEDPEWRSVWIEDLYAPRTIWERIVGAAKVLAGRSLCRSEMVLTEKHVEAMKVFFNSHG